MQSDQYLELVDTHCHLNFDVFDADRDVVLERARKTGVTRILIPGIDIATSKSAIELANNSPEVFAAIGIHPNSGMDWTVNTINEIKWLSRANKVVAIGEIGLDYYRDVTSREYQRALFKGQLELAGELNIPVIIHNRNASEDILSILQEWHQSLIKSGIELVKNPGVLHSFSGDERLSREAVALNFRLGITGPVTFKKSQDIQGVVRAISIENLLIETDAPFLTPHPFRGKRNEPANVRIVAEKIAELKMISFEEVAAVTTAQSDILFKWRNIH